MSDPTTCPGCGLELPDGGVPADPRRNASGECWRLYGEVQGYTLRHPWLVRDLHQLGVDAYAAQHAPHDPGDGPPPIGVAYALVGLHLALDRGRGGPEVRAAHQRMGRPEASWPRLPRPASTGSTTVFDVAVAGLLADSPGGHAGALRAWAGDVWRAWSLQHAAVAELTGRLLG